MNQKLSRLLEPNMKLYFFVLVAFALFTFAVDRTVGIVELVIAVSLYLYFRESSKQRRQGVLQYIDSVAGSVDTASKSTLINSEIDKILE